MSGEGNLRAKLSFYVGSRLVSRCCLGPGEEIVVGRGSTADVTLEDPTLSREHVKLALGPYGLQVTDLGSTNGTHLGLDRLPSGESIRQRPQETLRLGAHRIQYELTKVGVSSLADVATRRLAGSRLKPPALPPEEFEILGELGAGANGRVWLARQRSKDRKVAIKEMLTGAAAQGETLERFIREAKFLCRLKSPYVVRCYEVVSVESRPFLILEYVQGASAGDLLNVGLVEIARVLRIGQDVAQALAACRELGIVHRDVKPHNILISSAGISKLCDFGIAKAIGGQSGFEFGALTQAGFGLGSLPYTSPEQALTASEVDYRADIYSLGATLYTLASGRPPLRPGKQGSLLQQIQDIVNKQPPPLTTLQPDCPENLAALIHRMLAKSPADRPQSPTEIADELTAIGRDLSAPAVDRGMDDTWSDRPLRIEDL